MSALRKTSHSVAENIPRAAASAGDRGTKNNFTDLPEEMRPRERLMRLVSAESLGDAELLAILLKTGTHGCDVREVAERLLAALSPIWENRFSNCDWRTMENCIRFYNETHPGRSVKGVGKVKLLELQAAFELAKRLNGYQSENDLKRRDLRNPQEAFSVFERVIAQRPEQEYFFVLPMDSAFHPLCEPLMVAKGGVAAVSVHPREVFCEAVRWRAHAIIVAHNHPSGDPTPSDKDIELTEKLVAAAKAIHIPVLDHLVIAGGTFRSLREFC